MRVRPLLLLALALPLWPAGGEEGLEAELVLTQAAAVEAQLVKAAEAVRPSSVSIFNMAKEWETYTVRGCGSGVVIRAKGLILTNEHVIAKADRIEVAFLDGRRFPATVESRVPEYDIALLQVRNDKGVAIGGFKPAVFGKSPEPGRWVIATGNPFFLATSGSAILTLGTVSGLNRVMPGDFFYGNAIQHDAEINPGNSGGPLWDVEGRLLGINGKIASRSPGAPSNSGVGFTIPIEQIQNFLKGLLDGDGPIQPGDLGIAVETAKDPKGKELGARITLVRPGSAAERAKSGGALRVGDVIESLTVKGRTLPVRNATDYVNVITLHPPGTLVESLKIRRDGKAVTVQGLVLEPSR